MMARRRRLYGKPRSTVKKSFAPELFRLGEVNCPKAGRLPPAQQSGKQRRHGFSRRRMTPTHRVEQVRVEYVAENCPDSRMRLTVGWVQRTR